MPRLLDPLVAPLTELLMLLTGVLHSYMWHVPSATWNERVGLLHPVALSAQAHAGIF